MPYDDVMKHVVIVPKMNIIHAIAGYCRTLGTPAVRIPHLG